jgi:prolyl-tRNA synthetase
LGTTALIVFTGFYILEPSLFSIWEQIKDYFDTKIKSIGVKYYLLIELETNSSSSLGVRNCSWSKILYSVNSNSLIVLGYYPIFISKDNLEREKTHMERVEEECAWVTHGGKDKLERPIGVRQTSEFAMYKVGCPPQYSRAFLMFIAGLPLQNPIPSGSSA